MKSIAIGFEIGQVLLLLPACHSWRRPVGTDE